MMETDYLHPRCNRKSRGAVPCSDEGISRAWSDMFLTSLLSLILVPCTVHRVLYYSAITIYCNNNNNNRLLLLLLLWYFLVPPSPTIQQLSFFCRWCIPPVRLKRPSRSHCVPATNHYGPEQAYILILYILCTYVHTKFPVICTYYISRIYRGTAAFVICSSARGYLECSESKHKTASSTRTTVILLVSNTSLHS